MSFITNWHPLVTFFFYVNMLIVSMCFDHPILLVGTVAGSIGWLYFLLGWEKWLKNILCYIVLAAVIAVTNPLFSHRGETILFFINGNAITKEAFLYGLAMGGKMVAVLAYSRCFFEVFEINKLLYLFQKISPKLALLLSMALGFIPRFKRQSKEIQKMQKTMGMYSKHSYTDRVLSGIRVFDSMITWSLEQGVITADSMSARGYGQGKRTNFTIYRFGGADRMRMALLLVITATFYIGGALGTYSFSYYPVIRPMGLRFWDMIFYCSFACLVVMPVCLEIKEKMKWNVLQSKI